MKLNNRNTTIEDIASSSRKRKMSKGLLLALIFLLSLIVFVPSSAFAVSGDINNNGIADTTEATLAEKYAPILNFAPGERLFPAPVEYYLENCNLKQYVSGSSILIKSAPLNADDLAPYTNQNDNYYLDNTLGTINDKGIINDYVAQKSTLGYTVYARVTSDSDSGGSYSVVQYWFFYYFNPGSLNQHEGDWEMIQVVLDTEGEPVSVAYSQHMSGERGTWQDVVRDGDHPNVYVALGSHANYLRPFEGAVGLANDKVGDNGFILRPADYNIVMLGENGVANHDASQNWLDFAGYWGDYGNEASGVLGQRGPLGPAYSSKGADIWNEPLAAAETMTSVSMLWFAINWIVYNFVLIFALVILVGIVLRVRNILRRRRSLGLGPRLFSFLYVDGLNAKSIGNILVIAAIIAAIAALFFPWYFVNADISTSMVSTGGAVNVLSIDGINGLVVNWFMGDGIIQLFTLAVPFSIIVGAGILFFVLATVGVDRSSKIGWAYISRGIRTVVPVAVILAVVVLMGSVISFIVPLLFSDVPEEGMSVATDALNAVGRSPLGGTFETEVSPDGGEPQTIALEWSMGLGSYLLLLSAAFAIIAGILERRANTHFFGEGVDVDMSVEL